MHTTGSTTRVGVIHFANLTRGALCAPLDAGLTRIESTALEQHHWRRVVWAAGPALLHAIGSGVHVILHDYSERKRRTRAQYMGLPWLEYALARAGHLPHRDLAFVLPRVPAVPDRAGRLAGHFADDLFNEAYRNLDRSTRHWLRYFAAKPSSTSPCDCRFQHGSVAQEVEARPQTTESAGSRPAGATK